MTLTNNKQYRPSLQSLVVNRCVFVQLKLGIEKRRQSIALFVSRTIDIVCSISRFFSVGVVLMERPIIV
jgi:hypothetical protein